MLPIWQCVNKKGFLEFDTLDALNLLSFAITFQRKYQTKMKACYSCRNPFSSLDELNHLFSSKYTFAKFRKDFFFKLPLQYFRDQIELNYKICHCVLFRVIGIWWHTGLLGQWPLPTYLCKPYFDIWSKFVSCFAFPTKKKKVYYDTGNFTRSENNSHLYFSLFSPLLRNKCVFDGGSNVKVFMTTRV